MASVLDRRLVFVTGKGGVGKTAVATALGLIAARRGRRTIVAEVARRDDVGRTLGREGAGGAGESAIADGLHAISIDPRAALREYLADQLPSRALADLLASSSAFGYLAAATPGLAELLTVGKCWELAQPQRRTPGSEPYDLVVVDAPATGHALALLRAPRTFAGAARVGPIARQGGIIAAALDDPAHTAAVVVTTAEEMPVNETLELVGELGADRVGLVVANALRPARFSAAEARALAGRADHPAVRAALDAHGVQREQSAQLRRLRRGLSAPPARLPFAPDPQTGGVEVGVLVGALERYL